MVKSLTFASLILLLFVSTFAAKRQQRAPLPEAIMKAKTVYIQNESGRADLADRCFQELNDWGRLKVVLNLNEADIIFVITIHTTESGYSGYSAGSYTKVTAEQDGQTTISIVNSSTKEVAWTDTKYWGVRHGATKAIVKELRKRIEDQEGNSKVTANK